MRKYCESLIRYVRTETVPVQVGKVVIGGGNPVRIQSMANVDTNDTGACVAQAVAISDAGGELFRFTAQGIKEAENLKNIRERLRAAGYEIPLIADIHFNPEAAMIAARNIEKVRINPGNFVGKRIGNSNGYTDSEYAEEQMGLREKLLALLNICRANGTALRIGVNHGSLSERIMGRYGDTPAGMVESAIEFLRICKNEGFGNVVVSMKSSNVRVMIHAYRLLSATMRSEEMRFPLHLGVTEAGDGEDARVKSAIGIGALMADGLGDTIRVSLTESPEKEIPVAKKLAAHFTGRENGKTIPEINEALYSPFEYKKRVSTANGKVGGSNTPVVVVTGENDTFEPAPDLFIDNETGGDWLHLNINSLWSSNISSLKSSPGKIIVLETDNLNGIAEQRAFFLKLAEEGLTNPVIIKRRYTEADIESLQIKAACDLGMLLIDGFGDGIWIENEPNGNIPAQQIASLSFAILQAARVRISRTEYIACPGCGRTLFNLQETLAKVREKTSHLKGLKIGVMGCIVNGPGEMADADYGYVGAGPGKVTLYRGKEVVKRNIDQEDAIDELLEIIAADSGK